EAVQYKIERERDTHLTNTSNMKITFILLVVLCSVATLIATEVAHHESAISHSEDLHAGEHHATNKHVKKGGKSLSHDEELSSKGHNAAVHHKKDDAEGSGKKSLVYEHGSHSDHHAAGGGAHEAHEAREGEKFRKGQSVKGFREQYHKNEHKKHDSYYSNGHKSGSWKNFGLKGSKYQAHKVDKDDHGKHIVLKSNEKHSKQSKKSSGHKTDDHKGHKSEKGKKSGHSKHEKWAKNGQQKSQNK
ncbi:hypothetical protein AMK59_1197, partial [Oryctes borbonicus]